MPFYTTPDTLFVGPMCAPASWLSDDDKALWSEMGRLEETCSGIPPPPIEELRITAPSAKVLRLTDEVLLDALANDYFSFENVYNTTWAYLQGPSSVVTVTPLAASVASVAPALPFTRLFAPISVYGGGKRTSDEKDESEQSEPKRPKPSDESQPPQAQPPQAEQLTTQQQPQPETVTAASTAARLRPVDFRLPQPSAPMVNLIEPNSLEIMWSAVAGGNLYSLQVQRGDGWVTLVPSTFRVTHFMDDVKEGEYNFRVQAQIGGKWTPFSASSRTVVIASPAQPVSTAITIEEGGVAGATMYASLDELVHMTPSDFEQFYQSQRALIVRGEAVTLEGFSSFDNIPPELWRDLSDDTVVALSQLSQVIVYVQLSVQQILRDRLASNRIPTAQGRDAIDRYLQVTYDCIIQANRRWATGMAKNRVNKEAREKVTHILLEQWKDFIVQVGIPTSEGNATTTFFWSLLMGDSRLNLKDEANMFLATAVTRHYLPASTLSNWFLPVYQFEGTVPVRIGELLSDVRSWEVAGTKGMLLRGFLAVYATLRTVAMVASNWYLNVRAFLTDPAAIITSVMPSFITSMMTRDQTVWSQVFEYLPGVVRNCEWFQWLALPTDLVSEYNANGPGVLIVKMETVSTMGVNKFVVFRRYCVKTIVEWLLSTGIIAYIPYMSRLPQPAIEYLFGALFDICVVISVKFALTNLGVFTMSIKQRLNQFIDRFGSSRIGAWLKRRTQRQYIEHVSHIVAKAPIKYRCNPRTNQCTQVSVPPNFTDLNLYDTPEECDEACRLPV